MFRKEDNMNEVAKPIQDYVKKELDNFRQKYLSFRSRIIKDRALDTYDVSNKIAGSISGTGVIGKNQLKLEGATLSYNPTDTVKTASVTSGDQILGWYVSGYSLTPAASHLLLSITGTTLTGTLSAAPGGSATLTITVILLKP